MTPRQTARPAATTVAARAGRRVTLDRTTRETDDRADPRPRRDRTVRRSRPASASTITSWARSPTTACSTSRSGRPATSRSTSTTRSRTSRSSSGRRSPRRSAIAPGSPGSATPGSRWTRRSPSAVVDVGGRPVRRHRPARSGASGSDSSRSSSSSMPSRRSPGPPARPSTSAGTGRNDHHLAEAAFKALGRALRAACELDPRRAGVASTKGSSDDRPCRVAVVDYGAGNLVSIGRALESRRRERDDRPRPGRRSPARTRSSCPGSARRRRRWPASSGTGSSTRSVPGSAAGRPFLGICLGLQLLFDGSDEDGAETLGLLAGRTVALRDAADAARTSAGTRSSDGATHPTPRRHPRRRRPLLRPLLRRRAGRPGDGRRRDRPTAAGSRASSPATACSASSSTPSGAASTGCGSWPTSSRLARSPDAPRGRPAPRRPRRSGADADAPPAGHPVPRRGRRPGRQGHPLRRPRRRGRSGRARRALCRRGRRRARLPRHHGGARSDAATLLDVVERTARRGVHPADRRRRRPLGRRDASRPAGRRRQGRAQHGRGRATRTSSPAAPPGSGARRSSSRSTPGRATDGRGWEVVVRGGRDATGLDAVDWAVRAVELGAGELLVTSIDRDGTQSGLRHRACSGRSSTGSGSRSSPRAAPPARPTSSTAIVDGGADAVLAASIFHRRIHAIGEVKAAMAAAGLPVRTSREAAA